MDSKAECPAEHAKHCWFKILKFFNDDHFKALAWFSEKHPLLGDVTPYEMLRLGRGAKLLHWIQAQLNET